MTTAFEMNPIEQMLKTHTALFSTISKEQPITMEEFEQLFAKADDKPVDNPLLNVHFTAREDLFFQKSQYIFTHPGCRYLPPVSHKHDFFEILCVISGTHTAYIQNLRYELNPGDVLIIAPGEAHATYSGTDDAILLHMLIRGSSFERRLKNLFPINELLYSFFFKTLYSPSGIPYMLFQTQNDKDLVSLFLRIHQECSQEMVYKEQSLHALLSLLFINLRRNHEQNIHVPRAAERIQIDNTFYILQYMQKNFTSISLSSLASFFNYSERQVQRIITAATGKSFSENIRTLRMKKAAELLMETNMTITEIADTLGYYDASNFRHVFKQYYQLTPQQFRNQ